MHIHACSSARLKCIITIICRIHLILHLISFAGRYYEMRQPLLPSAPSISMPPASFCCSLSRRATSSEPLVARGVGPAREGAAAWAACTVVLPLAQVRHPRLFDRPETLSNFTQFYQCGLGSVLLMVIVIGKNERNTFLLLVITS